MTQGFAASFLCCSSTSSLSNGVVFVDSLSHKVRGVVPLNSLQVEPPLTQFFPGFIAPFSVPFSQLRQWQQNVASSDSSAPQTLFLPFLLSQFTAEMPTLTSGTVLSQLWLYSFRSQSVLPPTRLF